MGSPAAVHHRDLSADGHDGVRASSGCSASSGKYGVLLGAVCVGFVHHAFYEIFDQLGPQLRWWEWTTSTTRSTSPCSIRSRCRSVVVFAALWPMSLALCVQYLRRPPRRCRQAFLRPRIDVAHHRDRPAGLARARSCSRSRRRSSAWSSDTVRGFLYAAELAVLAVVADRGPGPPVVATCAGRRRTLPQYTERFVQWLQPWCISP